MNRYTSVWGQLQGQVYLGSETFVGKMQAWADKKPSLTEIPRAQRRALKRALSDYADAHARDEAIALAYLSGQHTMAAIAEHFCVHYTTVSRLVNVLVVGDPEAMEREKRLKTGIPIPEKLDQHLRDICGRCRAEYVLT